MLSKAAKCTQVSKIKVQFNLIRLRNHIKWERKGRKAEKEGEKDDR